MHISQHTTICEWPDGRYFFSYYCYRLVYIVISSLPWLDLLICLLNYKKFTSGSFLINLPPPSFVVTAAVATVSFILDSITSPQYS